MNMDSENVHKKPATDFIRAIITEDLKLNKNSGQVATRFPPEPNGYLHIGHAKSICLNFGIAADYQGTCNLRFDDTDPSGEDIEYVESIKSAVRWLGFDWSDREFYASDYFERLYEYAMQLIEAGRAYVCSLSPEEIREYRGTLIAPGKESPYRNRSVAENLDLFSRMRGGEFAEGAHVLRAKIDMASPNIVMRDPILYRIKKVPHYRTGNTWRIYPMYDFAHCLSDAIEGITHSICTLEFENNRPLYDWILAALQTPCHPQQIEFARLNLSHTIMSKRKLAELVRQEHVTGWDDPRMPTLAGMRRRGYTPAAIREFCERIGVAKRDSVVDMELLEHCVREDLNRFSPRAMAVLRPLKIIIDNYPEAQTETFDAPNHPQDPALGQRKIPFARELYIERDDFQEEAPKGFFRLTPGREVRLRSAYFIKCERVVKNEKTGKIIEVHCTYDPSTKGGYAPDNRKVKGAIHWVSAAHAVQAEVRLYDRLFAEANPDAEAEKAGSDFTAFVNPKSVETLTHCYCEPSLAQAAPEGRYQFERLGYFCVDPVDSSEGRLVFNRTVTLRDIWAKIAEKDGKG